MSQGHRVASTELEGPGYQPHLGEQGRGAGYAPHSERGLDRNSLRKGPLAHADLMGTSQKLRSPHRKGETLDMTAGRDFASTRPLSVRPSSNYGGSGPPVVVASHYATRALVSRPPPPPSAPFGALLSPRSYHSSSYRDAAFAAAQHGLSAYAQSAAAAAAASAASRALTPRSGGGAAGCGAASRPPQAHRPTQHSAPTPMAIPPELLPSCRAASPGRANVPPSRSSLMPSRGAAPPGSCSPGRAGGGETAAAAAAAAAVANHRSADVSMVTVTHNDLWWRGAFDGSVEPEDPLTGSGGGGGGGGGTARPVSGSAAGVIRGMSPGWGAAPPSVYEADGRPGTRGGGPQYDMDGRPTTRGGQRPPSRAQLSLSQQPRPPAHVAPLGGPGWAGMFAGGCGTVSGETTTAAPYTSPRAPSAGATLGWSGDTAEPATSHRRQLVPLPSAAVPGAGAAAGLGSPPPRGVGNASGAGGILVPLPPAQSLVLSPTNQGQQQGFQAPGPPPGQLLAPGGVSSSSKNNGGSGAAAAAGAGGTTAPGRAQLCTKLSSIAEAPGSPILLPMPPQLQQLQQQQQQQTKDLLGRMDSGGGRKASREREASFSSLVADPGGAGLSLLPGGSLEEGGTDDSYLCNLDQDAGHRGAGGRARLRRSSASTLNAGGQRGHGSLSGGGEAAAGGMVVQGVAGSGSPTDENPSTRPRR